MPTMPTFDLSRLRIVAKVYRRAPRSQTLWLNQPREPVLRFGVQFDAPPWRLRVACPIEPIRPTQVGCRLMGGISVRF